MLIINISPIKPIITVNSNINGNAIEIIVSPVKYSDEITNRKSLESHIEMNVEPRLIHPGISLLFNFYSLISSENEKSAFGYNKSPFCT